MLHKTEGIVLRTIKYSETSIIAKIYTRAFGLQSYIVKGVRSEKSKNKAAIFQPGNMLQMDVYKRNNKELNFIKEFKLLHFFPSVRLDILKSAVLLFMLEILNKTLKEEHANEAIFDFAEATFLELDKADKLNLNFHLQFLIDLSSYLGFRPSGEYDSLYSRFDMEEGTFVSRHHLSNYYMEEPFSKWMYELLNGHTPEGMNNHSREQFLEQLLIFYKLHLHEFGTVHAHRILHEVLHA
jgi:DNA repair protein RecO (recombination protein O)